MTEASRKELPSNRIEMINIMRQALVDPAGGPLNVDDEQLVMLATGRIDEISQPQRRQLLLAISEDPELGELVTQLAALKLEPAMNLGNEDRSEVVGRRLHLDRFNAFVRMAWAASVILLVGLLAWRVTESGQVTETGPLANTTRTPDLTVSQGNWGTAEKSEASSGLLMGLDIAMVVVLVVCVILAVAALWPVTQRLMVRSKIASDGDRGGD